MILTGSFNVCLSSFLWIRNIFAFFYSLGNLPLSKQDSKINFTSRIITDFYHSDTNHISWPWALFGSRFLIIFRILLLGKSIVVGDSHGFVLLLLLLLLFCFWERVCVAGSLLLFLSIEHWSAKNVLNI